MFFVRRKEAWFSLLLLFTGVSEIASQCAPICEQYHPTSLLAINSGNTHSFAITHRQANDSLFRLRNSSNVSLFTSREACAENRPAAFCLLLNVIHDGGGNFSGDVLCADVEAMRGQDVVFVLEMESLHDDMSNCTIFVDSFVYQSSLNVTEFKVERLAEQICTVTMEGCFPPCCGSNGSVRRVIFGENYRYFVTNVVACSKISISMPSGDSSAIYDERLTSLLEVTVQSERKRIDLILTDEDIDRLQNCFRTCARSIDIGHKLTALNYTEGCFSVNVTILPPEDVSNGEARLRGYTPEFTYCKVVAPISDLVIHIDCIGFNPLDRDIQEKIIVEISHGGVCVDNFTTKVGIPDIVPCMDRRCQDVAAYDVDFCLMVCVNNVATDDETVPLCEAIASHALEGTLSGQNVTVLLEILTALSNSSGLTQTTALNHIMEELLQQLGKEENLHLVSEPTGRSLLAVLDQSLRNDDDLDDLTEISLAQDLLNNLENVVKVIARALNADILSSSLEYTGTNAIVLMKADKIKNDVLEDGHYTFPKSMQGDMSGVRLEIPGDLLCGQAPNEDSTDCPAVVASVITKRLPQYLAYANSSESMVNSLLLSTVIEGREDYRDRIVHNPITIYFTPTPLMHNFSNETCVFWDPMKRVWSSDGVDTADSTGPGGQTKCTTTHLTSFAVLVDPASAESTAGHKALRIVSYVGCVISLTCLLISLLIFLTFGKSMNKGVLLYIHINFIVSLSLALALFVVGIETATQYAWVCTVVAAVLHYLFLCVFCWMLAEGIMLYMLVVRVFGSVAEKWYYLLLLGWGLPLPVVAISVGIRHEEYGTENYCWLSPAKGTYWAFLGPMIAIIMINSVILVVTVGSMIRSRRKFVGSKDSKNSRLALYKLNQYCKITTVKSTVILLPLLGLTWIIGPFSLLTNTDIFAWSFAILNSLQGLFFFLLHVLRNDKVYETIKKCIRCIPASVMEKPWSLRELSSNINLASAESVATASTSEGVSQLDCERITSPPFSIRIYQRKSSEGSATSLGHPTVTVFNH